jgi:hypothetical protein
VGFLIHQRPDTFGNVAGKSDQRVRFRK